jgi:cytoskeleton protein RodZ
MSRHKKNRQGKGSDKRMLAALESPVVVQEAELPVTNDAAHDMTNKANHPDEPRIAADTVIEAMASADAIRPDHQSNADSETPAATRPSLGQRLRNGREARGWTAEEVGTRLHLPIQIIQRLESEQYERIGYGIYLRGYLTSYARLVDVPTTLVDAVVRTREVAPQLVASGTISHSRYLYQRYSVSALYLILTGVIIVPAVLLAMRAGLQPSVAELASLEAPATQEPVVPASAGDQARAEAPVASAPTGKPAAQAAGNDTPLVASLAPFSALAHQDPPVRVEAAPRAAPEVPATPPAAGMHTLKLTLSEKSWVEVTSASGEKLEYGLLPAGSSRTYSSASALEVRLGNCAGAEVEIDGNRQDLTPFRHSNVAHFRLFTADGTISRTDS